MARRGKARGKGAAPAASPVTKPAGAGLVAGRFVQARILRLAKISAAILAILLVISACLSTRLYLAARAEIARLQQFELINRAQAEEIARLAARSEDLRLRLKDL